MLIVYNPAAQSDFPRALADYASVHRLFQFQLTGPEDDSTVSAADRSLDRMAANANRGVQSITANTVNLKELFPFSLVLYAVFFVNRAIGAAQWLSWMQFAFSSYMELHQAEPVEAVGRSVESLRDEIQALHAELRQIVGRLGPQPT